MEQIAIITDSSCDLPREFLKENNIYTLPLHIIYKDGEYRDGVDITPDQVIERFKKEIPSTSMPVPADLQQVFDDMKEKGIKKAVFVLISTNLSGTFAMVQLMCEMQKGIEYELVDAKTLTMGLGFIVEEAVRLRAAGLEFGRYKEKLTQLRSNLFGYFCIPSLEYLKKGGRINTVGAAVGNLLHICPIVFVSDEGVYVPAGIARGYKKAINKMKEIGLEKIRGYHFDIAMVHCSAAALCEEIMSDFRKLQGFDTAVLTCVSPALSVHVGEGLVGMILKRKQKI